ncbi:hypothetical protein ACIQZO_22105 [Streptomyces sp. NPDC097617]|uniref:hypothetical protein n=1 Tax=Streptomyces sp. NPDC097617 TaxID=3366091 RepID=UPI003811BDA6
MGTAAGDDVLPAEDEAAVFAHYCLPCQPGVNGERQFARRWCRAVTLFVLVAIVLGIQPCWNDR